MSGGAGVPAAGFDVTRVAERALLVRFHDEDLASAVARTHALLRALRARRQETAPGHLPEFEDQGKDRDFLLKGEWIPGAGNLLVVLTPGAGVRDVAAAKRGLEAEIPHLPIYGSLGLGLGLGPGLGVDEGLETDRAFDADRPVDSESVTEHVFEVRYGGEGGPDLEPVARELGLAPERVVELHSGARYLVAFVGFSPGFGYLIGLPRELEAARLESPRTRVPAGSVAVAGPFSGIYPSATPGGWRLIGRLADPEAGLFDAAAERPARLAAGDRVRFVACR
jgi:KipI family sensor histidine kinase inhibitor